MWTDWKDWEGGDVPPVPSGTRVDAYMMLRVEDWRRCPKAPHTTRTEFVTIDGASFLTHHNLGVPVLLVYRYRVWEDVAIIEDRVLEEVTA